MSIDLPGIKKKYEQGKEGWNCSDRRAGRR
jgi:hypothetical protein